MGFLRVLCKNILLIKEIFRVNVIISIKRSEIFKIMDLYSIFLRGIKFKNCSLKKIFLGIVFFRLLLNGVI